MVINLPWT